MISLMLMTENERERQILKMALEQRGLKVVIATPRFQTYIMALQYTPDIIFIELPRLHTDQVNFVQLIRKHKKTRSIPVIGYGDELDDPALKRGLQQVGIGIYKERPLKFSEILGTIDTLLRPLKKKIGEQAARSDKEKDIELILNSSAMPRQKIEAMCRHVEKLLAFPFTIAKVLQITQDPKSGAAQLAKAIQADPVISTNLLKVSNSVFFATTGRRIDSIKEAIVRIGFLETKKIAMTMSVMKLFDEKKKSLGFDRIDFWYHSLACGIVAEQAAKYMGGISLEAAFLAGLLHDLGIIIFDDFFPAIFDQILENTTQNAGQFIDQSTALLGVNHNDMIVELFETWKIPQDISTGIVDQYRIETFKENLDTTGKKLALCVAIGNTVAKTLHIGRECDEYIYPLSNWSFESTHMPAGMTPAFIDTIYQGVETYRQFLGLEQREYPREFQGAEDSAEIRIGFVNPGNCTFVPPVHYLAKQGISVETIAAGTPASSQDGKVNIIMICVDEKSTLETLNDCCHVVRYRKEAAPADAPIELAPVLLIIPRGWTMPENEQSKKMSMLPAEIDLRQFNKAISEILMGQVVRMPYPEKQAPKSAAAALPAASTTPGAPAAPAAEVAPDAATATPPTAPT